MHNEKPLTKHPKCSRDVLHSSVPELKSYIHIQNSTTRVSFATFLITACVGRGRIAIQAPAVDFHFLFAWISALEFFRPSAHFLSDYFVWAFRAL